MENRMNLQDKELRLKGEKLRLKDEKLRLNDEELRQKDEEIRQKDAELTMAKAELCLEAETNKWKSDELDHFKQQAMKYKDSLAEVKIIAKELSSKLSILDLVASSPYAESGAPNLNMKEGGEGKITRATGWTMLSRRGALQQQPEEAWIPTVSPTFLSPSHRSRSTITMNLHVARRHKKAVCLPVPPAPRIVLLDRQSYSIDGSKEWQGDAAYNEVFMKPTALRRIDPVQSLHAQRKKGPCPDLHESILLRMRVTLADPEARQAVIKPAKKEFANNTDPPRNENHATALHGSTLQILNADRRRREQEHFEQRTRNMANSLLRSSRPESGGNKKVTRT